MKLTGAQALIKSLEMQEVEVVFGLPGGAILPAYDPIIDSPIRHILVRHEQGAGHMAEGYAHVTGRPGVAMVTSGPAATNIVTPLCDAYMDSVPLVAITGQVAYSVIGTEREKRLVGLGAPLPLLVLRPARSRPPLWLRPLRPPRSFPPRSLRSITVAPHARAASDVPSVEASLHTTTRSHRSLGMAGSSRCSDAASLYAGMTTPTFRPAIIDAELYSPG